LHSRRERRVLRQVQTRDKFGTVNVGKEEEGEEEEEEEDEEDDDDDDEEEEEEEEEKEDLGVWVPAP